MKLFVGLGNPGEKFAGNRHNVGFMAVERIAAHQGLPPWRKRFQAMVTEGQIGSEKILLIKPQTYYNEVGRAVGEAARFHKIALADIVVFHDEIDLAPAKIRVKTGGGSAGNNGLKSITQHLGADFVRVRVGVGHPGQKELVAGYVLHDFPRADALWLETMLDAIAAASPRLAAGDIERFQTDVAQRMSAVAPRSDDKNDGSAARAPGSTSRPGRPPSSARQPGGKPAAGRPDAAKSRRSAPSQRDLARKSAAPAPRKSAAKQPPAAPTSPVEPEPAPSTALADRLKRWLTGQRKDD
ncbi:MAG: aminoacyl-tRNA hydrolase [Hyphomicrobiaceae bacterium]|nr:aminoacyl-tRNA hydrolase [Hyphomicrobiaceae bacterium]